MTIAASYNITPLHTDTAPPGEDLTGDDRKFLAYDSSDNLVVAATQGMVVAGVLVNQPQADIAAPSTDFVPEVVCDRVRIGVISGAAVTKGDKVTNDTAGKCITAAETNLIHGVARTTVAGANLLVMIDLNINSGTLLIADN